VRSSSSAQMTRVLVMSLRIFRGQASSMLGFRPTLVCTNQRSVLRLSTNHSSPGHNTHGVDQSETSIEVYHLYWDLHRRHFHHLPLRAGLGLRLLLLLHLPVHSSLPCKDNLARDCQPIGSSLPRPVGRVCLSVKSRGQQNIGCWCWWMMMS